MSTRRLPSKPHLEHLRNEARDLQRAARSGDPDAAALVGEHHPRPGIDPAALQLADAQLVVARQYGFPSWNRLRQHLAVIETHARSPHEADVADDDLVGRFLTLACLTYGSADSPDRREAARALLDEHPSIATADVWTMAAAGEATALAAALDADPDLVDRPGGPHRWEPLLYAAFSRVPLAEGRSTVEAARVLLDHGADPDAGYLWDGLPSPFTALTGAFGGGEDAVNQPPHPAEHELARLLLDAGADPNDNQALYNRMFDTSNDHLELLFAHGLGRGDGGPWRSRMPSAAESIGAMLAMQLQWAAEHGLVERVRLLLDHGVDPAGQSGHPAFAGRSALELARRRGHDQIAELLTAAGAAPADLSAEDALMAACLRGDRPEAERRLAADPHLLERVERSHAPMVVAAEMGDAAAIELLVALGFDVNALGRIAALHEAASTGNVEIARLLLSLGADPNLHDRAFDAPALGWARHNGHDEVAALLEPLTD